MTAGLAKVTVQDDLLITQDTAGICTSVPMPVGTLLVGSPERSQAFLITGT